ncbi:MAG: hypothetical protein HKL92_07400 [Candidatus Eremiobacteraeota bacterium]|nr:hypothetical protein [Candidatus Eremiobacteraeota bacterium]NNM93150.1 hypothetical protein [Candidatus Eremiobacteraeota bacterium]
MQIHAHGALVRFENGELASINESEVAAYRLFLEHAMQSEREIELAIVQRNRRLEAKVLPIQRDDAFEERLLHFNQGEESESDDDSRAAPPQRRRRFVPKKRDDLHP